MKLCTRCIMSMMRTLCLWGMLLWGTPHPLLAHPVIWKGGYATMAKATASQTELLALYSATYTHALGLHYHRFNNAQTTYVLGQNNWLLKRWNRQHSQGNVYLTSGLGIATTHTMSEGALHIGTQADWETRRLYTLFKGEYYSGKEAQTLVTGRIGIAPYLGTFNTLHTWVMVQVQDQVRHTDHTLSVLPIIRFFKDTVLIELGSNFSGQSHLAAMIHF